MNYKLICIDMDGTLLSDAKKVPEENIIAIKKARELGVKIAITTGRMFTSARYFAELIEAFGPVIASNGAYIREHDGEKEIEKYILGKENALNILEVLKNYDINTFFNTHLGIVTNKPVADGNTYMEMNKKLPEDLKIKFFVYDDLKNGIEIHHEEILKCICIDKDLDKISEIKKEILKIPNLEVVSSHLDNFEIMTKGVSKGRAVEAIAKYYKIKREEIICIGDGENDLSMIEFAGLGIAMGNASDEVKAVAGYTTDTNENAGVAKAIEKFILS